MLLGFTEFFLKIEYHLNKFCQVLPSFPELNRYFLDFKPFQGVLPNFLTTTIRFTGFLPSFPKFHRMVPGFTEFSWNLPSFLKIECHWNKLPSFPSSAEALASNSINLIVSDCNFFLGAGRTTNVDNRFRSMETAIAGPGGPVRPIPRLSLGFIFFLLFLFGPFGLFFSLLAPSGREMDFDSPTNSPGSSIPSASRPDFHSQNKSWSTNWSQIKIEPTYEQKKNEIKMSENRRAVRPFDLIRFDAGEPVDGAGYDSAGAAIASLHWTLIIRVMKVIRLAQQV